MQSPLQKVPVAEGNWIVVKWVSGKSGFFLIESPIVLPIELPVVLLVCASEKVEASGLVLPQTRSHPRS